jgi:LmbE family N-acetylglucosaminyl deacetylase
MWIAAHPDDESMAGPVLARACIGAQLPCHMVVMTRDEGGECLLEEGCHPNLATVRHLEMNNAARLYRATFEQHRFSNAPLPVSSFPSREELERRWASEGDPARTIARAIRRFRPDTIITLAPIHGFTGHPEHQATARFALRGARLAAEPNETSPMLSGEPPHKVSRAYEVLNRYWFMVAAGDGMDVQPYNETIDGDQPCDKSRGRSCVDVMVAASWSHKSQASDMDGIRTASPFWGTSYIHVVDPFGAEADELLRELP